MEVLQQQSSAPVSHTAAEQIPQKAAQERAAADAPAAFDETSYELGLWLAGIECYLESGGRLYAERGKRPDAETDHRRSFRLLQSGFLLCSEYCLRLQKMEGGDPQFVAEIHELSLALRDLVIIGERLGAGSEIKFADWKAWKDSVSAKFATEPAFRKLILLAERSGENYIPERLLTLIETRPMPFMDRSDLNEIVPQFGRILRWLSVIGQMLKRDEPLKPSLLIFAKVHQQTSDLITYINNRLLRFPNEEAELFRSLDAASYTASIELKKIFNQELAGIMFVRPANSVYARVETAYALLNDGFQNILGGFARAIDDRVRAAEMFPAIAVKQRQSQKLRADLGELLGAVQAAEQEPATASSEGFRKRLSDFMSESALYLFYKDQETVERFVEEVLATGDKKDIVPILHRFGAYLETLHGQIEMRVVLAEDH